MFENTKKMVAAGFCASSIYNSINAKCCCGGGDEQPKTNVGEQNTEYKYDNEGVKKLLAANYKLVADENIVNDCVSKVVEVLNCNNGYYKEIFDMFDVQDNPVVKKFIVRRGDKVSLEDSFNKNTEKKGIFALPLGPDEKDNKKIKYDASIGGKNTK